MGMFDKAKGAVTARKAYQTYVSAVEAADKDQPEAAREKYHASLDLYEKAVKLGADSPNTLLSYALLLTREGEFDRAKAMMQDISRINGLPDDARFQLRIQYSILLWKTGQLDEAIATIRRAAGMKMNSTVYNTLGMFLVDKAKLTGDFDEALEFNLKALDYDDEDGDCLDNLGQLYEAMSDAEAARGDEKTALTHRAEAKAYYTKAHERKPRQITTIYYLARMHLADGEREAARNLVENAHKLYYSAICPISWPEMDALRREIDNKAG